MSLFSPPRTERRDNSWSDWGAGGAAPSTAHDPTRLVPYFSAIRHIVDYMSTIPVDGKRADVNGKTPMSSLPTLFRRLNAPGGIGIGNWIGQWAYGLAVDGNAVGWITAVDGFGFPTDIRWIRRIQWNFDEWTGIWRIFGVVADPARIVHQPWVVPSGYTLGISPVEHFCDFFKGGKAAQDYADVSRGGGAPPTSVRNTVLTELDPAASREIQRQAMRTFAAGAPWVSGKDWELEIHTIPPNQAQFLQTVEMTANLIAGMFGIDPREIGGTGADGTVTYRTDESRALNRANDMRPYIERFEEMVNRLLPEPQSIRMNVDATLRSDTLTRTTIQGLKLANGTMNINEARAQDDLPSIGAQGDVYRISATPSPTTAPTPALPASGQRTKETGP